MSVHLTDDQQDAMDQVLDWVKHRDSQHMTLGGYAGTGKTFCVKWLVEQIPGVRVLAPTGKACQVLRRKGVEANTLHSWLYGAPDSIDWDGAPVWGEPDPPDRPSFLIVDEASMVEATIYAHLMGLRPRIRVLFVGDHGQLEPVGKNPELMKDPDVKLETILRQNAESPILRFAYRARTGMPLFEEADPELTIAKPNGELTDLSFLYQFDQVITYTNKRRQELNRLMRSTDTRLLQGDRVICLRNHRSLCLYNGLIGRVTKVREDDTFDFVSDDDDERYYRHIRPSWDQFGAVKTLSETRHSIPLFDYAYAITCRKAQGSEWESVLVVEDPQQWPMDRWRYTAITRAKSRLTFLSPRVRTKGPV